MPSPMPNHSRNDPSRGASCSPRVLDALVAKVRQHLGADYSGVRRNDLVRLLALAGLEQGAEDPGEWLANLAFAEWDSEQAQALTPFLTVGETYFRRDNDAFIWLQAHFLPSLIARRRQENRRRVRCWSAGCCSGEEAYSLLFLLDEMLGAEPETWDLEVLGTDVNRRFLAAALDGLYSQNAFRLTDAAFRQRYFEPAGRQWRVKGPWRSRIRFSELNLATALLPQADGALSDCDLILCRNVLMYFVPEQAAAILRRLLLCLSEDGLLLLSAVEAGIATLAGLRGEWVASNYGLRRYAALAPEPPPVVRTDAPIAVTAHRRRPTPAAPPHAEVVPAPALPPLPPTPTPAHWQAALAAYAAGQQVAVQHALHAYLAQPGLSRTGQYDACLLMARSRADQHELNDASAWLDRALTIDRTDARAYWLQALLLQQRNATEAARTAIQKALYLEPDFVMANFLHAQLLLKAGETQRAQKALATCEQTLATLSDSDIIPDSDGLSVAQVRRLCHHLHQEALRCRPR